MSFGGFGLSPGDFVLLVQLARRTFRNCQQAGDEYAEIASEVRCLYSVLGTVRTLAERPDSSIFRQDRTTTAQLTSCADGCKNVLDDLDYVLAKYTTLNGEGQSSVGKKIWQRFRFGSKIQELGVVRGKLITYKSTMSILLDTMQSQALDRVEDKIDDGFGEVKGEFERMRKEIYSMASQARTSDKNGSSLSLLSLSTYSGDEKETWRTFRRELIMKGFRSRSLDKYGHVLQAYMLKLDQSGLLDQARTQESTSINERGPTLGQVAFATTPTSQALNHGTGQIPRAIKSILRHPTSRFPEEPNYAPEGVGLRESCLGGTVPEDARITILDTKFYDITAVRWLFPRCEDRGDHIIVFQMLDKEDIKLFELLTNFFRENPDLELHWLFKMRGEGIRAMKLNSVVKYRAYKENYPNQRQSSEEISRVSLLIFENVSKGCYRAKFAWLEELDECSAESKQIKDGMFSLFAALRRFSRRDLEALNKPLERFYASFLVWVAKYIRVPKNVRDEVEYIFGRTDLLQKGLKGFPQLLASYEEGIAKAAEEFRDEHPDLNSVFSLKDLYKMFWEE